MNILLSVSKILFCPNFDFCPLKKGIIWQNWKTFKKWAKIRQKLKNIENGQNGQKLKNIENGQNGQKLKKWTKLIKMDKTEKGEKKTGQNWKIE